MHSDEHRDAFRMWERIGRGWEIFEFPVYPEPVFTRFTLPVSGGVYDDGWVSLSQRLRSFFLKKKTEEHEPEPASHLAHFYEGTSPRVCQLLIPKEYHASREKEKELLALLAGTTHPVGFEIVHTNGRTTFQITCQDSDLLYVTTHVRAYLPEVSLVEVPQELPWVYHPKVAIVDIGLSHEWYFPFSGISLFKSDPLFALYSMLQSLTEDECALLQCQFEGVAHGWQEEMLTALEGFNAPDHLKAAEEKCKGGLYAVTLRLVLYSDDEKRTKALLSNLLKSFHILAKEDGNALLPLSNEGITLIEHVHAVQSRTSKRTGMLLSLAELHSLVHVPGKEVAVLSLQHTHRTTKRIPPRFTYRGYFIGTNVHEHASLPVYLNDDERLRHMHVLGATGGGKSTFLAHLMLEDMRAGNGCMVVDAQGDLVDEILTRIPEERLPDTIVVDPKQGDCIIGLNLLHASTEEERLFLAEELMEVIASHATTWGDQMSHALAQAIHTVVAHPEGGTLFHLRQFLVDMDFRHTFLKRVNDPFLVQFWKKEYSTSHAKAIAPIVTRLDTFLRSPIIRSMMATRTGLDLSAALAGKKIILLKLSEGLIGTQNAELLGGLFLTKLYQAAFARQNLEAEKRSPFYVFLDEFYHFRTKSLIGLLTGARKYGIGLVLAHQHLDQLSKDKELEHTLLSNVLTQIAFRTNTGDAVKLEKSFPGFAASDFTSLAVGDAILRVGADDCSLQCHLLPEPDDARDVDALSLASAERYGIPRADADALVSSFFQVISPPPQEVFPEEPRPPVPPIPTVELSVSKEEYLQQEAERERTKEHMQLQREVKKLAQSKGWHATIEAPIIDGGRIDVLLLMGTRTVGVEISVTNTPGYEVENIRKCLAHGCDTVIMMAKTTEKAESIRSHLRETELEKTRFFTIAELTDWLVRETPTLPSTEQRIRGYTVKVKYSPEESADTEEKLRDILRRSNPRNPSDE